MALGLRISVQCLQVPRLIGVYNAIYLKYKFGIKERGKMGLRS